MDKNSELIHQMAEVYITCVRDLETQIRDLKAENDSLRTVVKELREATDTIYTPWEGQNYE